MAIQTCEICSKPITKPSPNPNYPDMCRACFDKLLARACCHCSVASGLAQEYKAMKKLETVG